MFRFDWLYRHPMLAPDEGAGGGDDGGDGDDGTDEGGDDGEKITLTKSEHDALRRELAESRRAAKKAKADADKAAQEKAKKEGDFERLAQEAQKRAEDAENKLAEKERDAMVSDVAKRLKFRVPGRAARFLDEDDMQDAASVERALKALKRDEPDLFTTGGRTGGDIDTAGKSGGNSMDQLIRQSAGY